MSPRPAGRAAAAGVPPPPWSPPWSRRIRPWAPPPAGRNKVAGAKRRTFPVPGFDPVIVKIRVAGDPVRGA